MKKIILLIILSLSTTVYAAPVSKIILQNYTGASSITCKVWGQNQRISTDVLHGYYFVQEFTPDDLYSRSYTLASAHAYGDYSTNYGSGIILTQAQWSCVDTATQKTAEPVKVYLNSIQNALFMPYTTGTGSLGIGYNRVYEQ